MRSSFCWRAAEAEAEVAFFCVARIWESRDHGTLYFLALLRCAHLGVPRSWHPIFCLRARVAEAGTITSYLGSCWDTSR